LSSFEIILLVSFSSRKAAPLAIKFIVIMMLCLSDLSSAPSEPISTLISLSQTQVWTRAATGLPL